MRFPFFLLLLAFGCAMSAHPLSPKEVMLEALQSSRHGLEGEAELEVRGVIYRALLALRRPSELHVLLLDPAGFPLWEAHARGGRVSLPGLPSLEAADLVSLLMGVVPTQGRLYRCGETIRLCASGVQAEFRGGKLYALRLGKAKARYLKVRPDGSPQALRLRLPRGVEVVVRYIRITPLPPSS